jgi:type IV pilus assembly protein PilQ
MSIIRRLFLAVIVLLIGLSSAHAQRALLGALISSDETISFSSETPFHLAIEILNEMSKQYAGKPIIVDRKYKEPVNIEIQNLPWKRALEHVVEAHGLKAEEHADYFRIVRSEEEEEVKPPELEFDLDTKEVRIAAIFFEGNRSALKDLGVNWTLLGQPQSPVEAREIIMGGNVGLSLDVAKNLSSALDVTGILQAFESRDIGEVIANPQITVISGQEGRIQVGDDIPYVTRDEAGNVFPTFVSTGIILTVNPEIISQDGVEFIHLEITTERSSGAPGALAPTVTRASTSTAALLRDGEQVVIAGLYSNQELVSRAGIPFLRNLPWWVFGLRYLTGYNSNSIVKKELIVLIQANIVPSVRERTAGEQETMQEMFERERREFQTIQKGLRGARKP